MGREFVTLQMATFKQEGHAMDHLMEHRREGLLEQSFGPLPEGLPHHINPYLGLASGLVISILELLVYYQPI